MTTNEGNLLSGLEDAGHPDALASAPDRYVLTSNFTLPIMLARGVLLAPGAGESSEVTMLDAWGCELPKHDRGIPGNWAEAVEKSGRNVFPIALRLAAGKAVGEVTVAGRVVEYLLLSSVEGVVFRSEGERDRFLSWGFDNVPDAGLSKLCAVDGEVFGVAPEPLAERRGSGAGLTEEAAVAETADPEGERRRRESLARADSVAGLIAVVVGRASRVPGWVKAVGSLSDLGSNDRSGTGHPVWEIAASLYGARSSSANDLDSALLHAAARVMARHPHENGWPASQVLEDVCVDEEVRDVVRAEGQNGEKLAKWKDRCEEVIAARAAPPDLSDFGSVVRRGILLLLLRGGDVTEIAETPVGGVGAGLVVGKSVRMVAFALAGLRTGLRALPADYKVRTGPAGRDDWRDPLSRFLVADLGRGDAPADVLRSARIMVSYRRRGTLEGDWVTMIADARPIEVRAEFDDRLREVAARLKRLGFTVRDEGEERLVVEAAGTGGRTASVLVTILSRSHVDAGIVRCIAEVKPIEQPTPRSRKKGRKPISAMPKDFFVGLLKDQMQSHLNARYALSEDGETLYVVSEQALATLDDAEFKGQLADLSERVFLATN